MILEPSPSILLLAEDDADIAFLFRRMFRCFEPAWRLEWRKDGLEAIDYCMTSGSPDLVVTDLNMPGMSGLEVIAWLRGQPKPQQPPVVVYSASDDETTREQCRAAGASDFISKAEHPQRLRELVRRILLARDGGPIN